MRAFYECKMISSVTIPSSLESIESSAFSGCTSLEKVTFEMPSHIKIIGSYAFYRCKALTEFSVPKSVILISHYAFSSCSSLEEISVPSSVKTIEDNALADCLAELKRI